MKASKKNIKFLELLRSHIIRTSNLYSFQPLSFRIRTFFRATYFFNSTICFTARAFTDQSHTREECARIFLAERRINIVSYAVKTIALLFTSNNDLHIVRIHFFENTGLDFLLCSSSSWGRRIGSEDTTGGSNHISNRLVRRNGISRQRTRQRQCRMFEWKWGVIASAIKAFDARKIIELDRRKRTVQPR